ncbi:hypothetical protein CcaCcLH18_09533 [Colletotrichum camelliae]|nr:hypothetical protein CcaCcLH18_09533 [Colletotrichum camelliae]
MAIADPPNVTSGRSFPRFPEFPTEIKVLVWEQFYLEPRHFIVEEYQWNNGDERGLPGIGDSTDGLDGNSNRANISQTFNAVTWCFHAASSSSKYYNDIDTTINRISSSVAFRLRPRFWLPMWSLLHEYHHLESYDSNCCKWSPTPSCGYPEANQHTIPADPRINWNTDFIHFAFNPIRYFPHQFDWFANIQNIVTSALWNPTGSGYNSYWVVQDVSSWDGNSRVNKVKECNLYSTYLSEIIQDWVLDQTCHTGPNSCAWWCKSGHTSRRSAPLGRKWPRFVRRADRDQLRTLDVNPDRYVLSERDITKDILLVGDEVESTRKRFSEV